MYVTSILCDVFKLETRMGPSESAEFSKFVKDLNEHSESFICYDKLYSGFTIFLSSDQEYGKWVLKQFKIFQGFKEDEIIIRCNIHKYDLHKFVANFHTKHAALEFVDYLNKQPVDSFKGVDKVIRNSVIFYCLFDETGYELAKDFEEIYANKVLEKAKGTPDKVHPIQDDQKVYELTEETVQAEDGTTNKIFNIFKVNPTE